MTPPPFERFYDAHRAEVFSFLSALVGPSVAEDCFQETFLAALRAYPRLHADSNLRGWVLTIARRKAIDAVRGSARLQSSDAGLEQLPAPSAPMRDHEIWGAVLELPAKQRGAVFLRFAADLPHREIGVILGCSEAAARRNAHEGLKKLKEAV